MHKKKSGFIIRSVTTTALTEWFGGWSKDDFYQKRRECNRMNAARYSTLWVEVRRLRVGMPQNAVAVHLTAARPSQQWTALLWAECGENIIATQAAAALVL